MILVLGPIGSGKTLLLKRLEEHGKTSKSKKGEKSSVSLSEESKSTLNEEEREKVPATVPTIGSNFCNVSFGRHKEISLKEVGGSMAPLWKSSYADADKLMYIIDMSNPFQVSGASALLRDILSADKLQQTPMLLVLNKIDNFCSVSHTEMKYLLGLDVVLGETSQKVTIIEASAKYGSGVDDIIKWICDGT